MIKKLSEEGMGSLIKNLAKERSELKSSFRDISSQTNTIKKTIKTTEITIQNLEYKIQEHSENITNHKSVVRDIFSQIIALEFKDAINNTDSASLIESLKNKLLEKERLRDSSKLLLPALNKKLSSYKITLQNQKVSLKELKRQTIRLSQKIRDNKENISNVNRELSASRIKKVSIENSFKNINNCKVIVMKYEIYDTNNLDMYVSYKTYVMDILTEVWYQAKPSGLKEVKSVNKIHTINRCLSEMTENKKYYS